MRSKVIQVKYSEPELKEIIEGIIGKNFFIFCNDTISQVVSELNLPARLMNQITITLQTHHGNMGLVSKSLYLIILRIQDTLEENEKTLIHETIHVLKPTWDENTVEEATNKIYQENTKEILIWRLHCF